LEAERIESGETMKLVKANITEVEADVIVNAANAWGYMGGWWGRYILLPGVAESIHYETKGVVEAEARQLARKFKHRPGEVFITSSGGLPSRYVFHAVTMAWPGTWSRLSIIENCIQNIFRRAKALEVKSIAIPGLGTGTGRLSKQRVAKLFYEYFSPVQDVEILIVDKAGGFLEAMKRIP
jgi:O-acetyl-ADP-ribose deacetylase